MVSVMLQIAENIDDLKRRFPDSTCEVYVSGRGGVGVREWRGTLDALPLAIGTLAMRCPQCEVRYKPDDEYGIVLKLEGRCTPETNPCGGPCCGDAIHAPAIIVTMQHVGDHDVLLGDRKPPSQHVVHPRPEALGEVQH